MSTLAETTYLAAGRRHSRAPELEKTTPLRGVDREDIPHLFLDANGWAYELVAAEGPAESGRIVIRRSSPPRNLRDEFRRRFGLTAREIDIVMLLGRRATNREISEELRISLHTSRHHTASVLEKLGLKSRSEVRRLLMRTLTHPPRTGETKP